MARRSHSVADPARRFPVMQVDYGIEEQYSDDEGEGDSDDAFSKSTTCLGVVPTFSGSCSPLRRSPISACEPHDFRRRTRVIKGRPESLQQRLDVTEWREIDSVRMRDTNIGRREKRPSLQMVKIDPSLKNLSVTVENAVLRAKLGLTRGRVPSESSQQPLQVPVSG